VRVAAGVAVLMSFLILMGVIFHNLILRRPEFDIQKLLGADRSMIRNMIVGEYLALAFGASLLGAAFAIAMTALVTHFIFEVPTLIDLQALLVSTAGTLLLTSALSYLSATRLLGQGSASTKL
jgi:predicted lysophospholipase L1 biosynthesis ABC-type transport system permease subunit